MRPWARWTARMALAAVVSATAGGGPSGLAFAGPGGDGSSASTPRAGGDGLLGSLGVPDDVCADTGALLGIAVAGCRNGTAASFAATRAAGDTAGLGRSESTLPGTAGTAGTGPRGAKAGDRGRVRPAR